MREITPYGGGVSVLITCENRPDHDWMSFISWYSVKNSLPDARIAVSCVRGNYEMLKWCPRQRIPYFFHTTSVSATDVAANRSYVDKPMIVIRPEVTVHETLPHDLVDLLRTTDVVNDLSAWTFEAKNQDLRAFSSIAGGCKGFRESRWIDKGENPLSYAERFLKGDLNANERRIFSLWYRAAPLYDNIG